MCVRSESHCKENSHEHIGKREGKGRAREGEERKRTEKKRREGKNTKMLGDIIGR